MDEQLAFDAFVLSENRTVIPFGLSDTTIRYSGYNIHQKDPKNLNYEERLFEERRLRAIKNQHVSTLF